MLRDNEQRLFDHAMRDDIGVGVFQSVYPLDASPAIAKGWTAVSDWWEVRDSLSPNQKVKSFEHTTLSAVEFRGELVA